MLFLAEAKIQIANELASIDDYMPRPRKAKRNWKIVTGRAWVKNDLARLRALEAEVNNTEPAREHRRQAMFRQQTEIMQSLYTKHSS